MLAQSFNPVKSYASCTKVTTYTRNDVLITMDMKSAVTLGVYGVRSGVIDDVEELRHIQRFNPCESRRNQMKKEKVHASIPTAISDFQYRQTPYRCTTRMLGLPLRFDLLEGIFALFVTVTAFNDMRTQLLLTTEPSIVCHMKKFDEK
jgi:hypothetical protein